MTSLLEICQEYSPNMKFYNIYQLDVKYGDIVHDPLHDTYETVEDIHDGIIFTNDCFYKNNGLFWICDSIYDVYWIITNQVSRII
jgi:hypothetical protein